MSAFHKGTTRKTHKMKSYEYIKDKLWLSSINPIRAGILEAYQRSESLKYKFSHAMEILKRGLLKLSLNIYFKQVASNRHTFK